MISVEQAIQIVVKNVGATQDSEQKKVSEANGCIICKDVISPISMPPFRQSAMDGYALSLNGDETYTIIGEVKAGDHHHPTLKTGEAIRIFTGAPVPDSANAVIMQEKTRVDENILFIDAEVSLNDNIRSLGEQVSKSQLALNKGTRLTPAALAFLTSLGITEVPVYKTPSIAIIVTGNELAEAGQSLKYGQIYESNALMLKTALDNLGFQEISTFKVADNYIDTLNLLDTTISNHDMILVSGGISVGDYDFVGKALQELEVEQLFYKVKQKPGKPLFFGKKEDKIIFALPGNPAAALSCFYVYVYAALQNMSGNSNLSLARTTAKSKTDYIKKGDRAQFLKAIYNNGTVDILDGQNSSMLHTFALANALVYLPETSGSVSRNNTVEVILLPIN